MQVHHSLYLFGELIQVLYKKNYNIVTDVSRQRIRTPFYDCFRNFSTVNGAMLIYP